MIVDLLGQRIGELRIGDQIGGEPVGDLLAQSRYPVIQALIVSSRLPWMQLRVRSYARVRRVGQAYRQGGYL